MEQKRYKARQSQSIQELFNLPRSNRGDDESRIFLDKRNNPQIYKNSSQNGLFSQLNSQNGQSNYNSVSISIYFTI